MKKQLIAIGLASVLTAPSVALAQEEEAAAAEEMAVEEIAVEEMAVEEMAVEAPAGPSVTIYGSFRTGLEFESGGGASDATVTDFGSRVGIMGSTEVSEGLTASFKFENGLNTATATIGAGRIGMVGLSGGFGSLALGQFDSASTIHFGNPTNPTQTYGVAGGNTGKPANMVSYSSSVGALGFQIDRHTDANDVATVEFGATAAAGPVNVGFAYWGKEDSTDDPVTTNTTTNIYEKVEYTDGTKDSAGDLVEKLNGYYTVEDVDGTVTTKLTRDTTAADLAADASIAVLDENGKPITDGSGNPLDKKNGKRIQVTVTGATITSTLDDDALESSVFAQETTSKKNPKTSFTGFFVSSSLAGMNLALGVGSTDLGVDDVKATDVDESQTDVSIVALSGAVGDSGVSYGVRMHDSDDVEDATTGVVSDPSHTVVNLTSVLGGGASLVFETVSYKDGDDASLVALKIDF